jgi:maltose O-acetyltransferase
MKATYLMSEKQKMLAGELYLASDPELKALHNQACHLTRLYNATTEDEIETRIAPFTKLIWQAGI